MSHRRVALKQGLYTLKLESRDATLHLDGLSSTGDEKAYQSYPALTDDLKRYPGTQIAGAGQIKATRRYSVVFVVFLKISSPALAAAAFPPDDPEAG